MVVVLQDLELADRATRTLVEQWARLTRRVAFGLVVAHSDPGCVVRARRRRAGTVSGAR